MTQEEAEVVSLSVSQQVLEKLFKDLKDQIITQSDTITEIRDKVEEIRGKVDLFLSPLRDDLRGADARTLTDIYNRLRDIKVGPDGSLLVRVIGCITT